MWPTLVDYHQLFLPHPADVWYEGRNAPEYGLLLYVRYTYAGTHVGVAWTPVSSSFVSRSRTHLLVSSTYAVSRNEPVSFLEPTPFGLRVQELYLLVKVGTVRPV